MRAKLRSDLSRLAAAAIAAAILAGAALAPPADAAPGGRDAARGEELRRAVDALELGDVAGAADALALLAQEDAAATPVTYLRARLAEQRRAWEEALAEYHRLLIRAEPALERDWFRLASNRWVRARQARDVERVRASLLRETPPPAESLRTLVLPLEPLLPGREDAELRSEATVLGLAAAEWTLQLLVQASGRVQPTLTEALLLRQGQVSLAAPVPEGEAADPGAPLVSTLEGVLFRLQFLEPSGPPPWAPGAEPPARYLPATATLADTREITRAVAHFQSEQELAPTGIVDPETRRRLERAYRSARNARTLRAPALPGDDPVLAAARRAGVAIALTGTLEPLGDEGWRWQAAWVSPADGAVLAQPVGGILSRRLFGEAWARMLSAIVGCWPGATSPWKPEPAAEEMPSGEGAILYGRALQALAEGESEVASALFARADRAGAGTTAAWFAQAWSLDAPSLRRLERSLLEAEIRGPRRLDARLLEGAGRRLAGALRCGGDPAAQADPAGFAPGSGLSAFPEEGWLLITGSLE